MDVKVSGKSLRRNRIFVSSQRYISKGFFVNYKEKMWNSGSGPGTEKDIGRETD